MKKILVILSVLIMFGLARTAAAYTTASSLMTNLVKVTAYNSIIVPVDFTNVTVATMFGANAVLSNGYYQNIPTFGRFVWTINVTNNGNSAANFTARVAAVSNRNGGGAWAYHFLNLSGLSNLTPGAWGTVQFVITNATVASNNAFNSCLVKFSNATAPQTAKAYYGFDGLWYGSRLGLSTNLQGTNTAANPIGPVCYLQHPTTASNLAVPM